MTDREWQVLQWMRERNPADDDIRWYTDQIGTSARLLSNLEKRGLLRRHDPHTNFYVRAGSMAIKWSLSEKGKRMADENRSAGSRSPAPGIDAPSAETSGSARQGESPVTEGQAPSDQRGPA